MAIVALGITTPAGAQFGGLKKKLKATAAPKATKPAATEDVETAEAQAGGADAGTMVLTPDVLDQLVTGLRAGEAERQAAAKEDTPYGRHRRAARTYETAKLKCQQGQQTFPTRMAADEKLADQYGVLVNKMVDAQGRGDNRAYLAYNDSAMAMQDPNCVIKEPKQPDDFYETERAIETRAEKASIKASGFTRSELGQVRERAEAILQGGTPPGDVSASEKTAVASHAAELKRLLGIREAQAAAAPAPTPSPTPAAAPPAGSSEMGACMGRNAQKHEPELRALAKRGETAQQAGNTAALLAIADTMQRLQMAGCGGGR